ncbi:MAG TPA: hypothetical protein VIT23_03700 [Terrimicrobiaceae bacterium]
MQTQLADSTVDRVEEMGLLPKTGLDNGQQPTDLQNFSPRGEKSGEQLLPPKPSAVVQVPDTPQGVQIPKNPDTKQRDEQDKQAWRRMENDNFGSLTMLAVTVGAFLLVSWVATKGLFFFLQESSVP